MILLTVAICCRAVTLFAQVPSTSPPSSPPIETTAKPNVLLIMADDLGFSDLGCYGGEIQTPNLDRLAENGLRFTSFYNTGRCWPTRGSLLTGYYPHQIRRDTIPNVVSGGRGKRPEWAPLAPALLRPLGYRSYHSGKWHIDGMPVATGFDRSYYLGDQGRFFYPRVHYLDDQKLPAVKPDEGYYGTTEIANRAIEFLQQHQREHAGKPFFHYVAFTAPHFPLHALPEDIAKYQGRYDAGWGEARKRRYSRQREIGLLNTPLSAVETNVGPPYHFADAFEILGPGELNRPAPWDSLTEEQRRFQATKMSLHAAMVDRVDQEIGRILNQLQAMQVMDNTLILFLSDNGASAEIMVRTDGHDPNASPGSGPSYLCLGPGWSTVSNTPFRRHKTWVHEGGISTPLIAHWPARIRTGGKLCQRPGHVVDIVPTLLELCGAGDSTTLAAGAPARPGQSLATELVVPATSDRSSPPPTGRALWWLHEENRAIRKGDLKLVAAKGDPWALYDLSTDRAESHDLASERPNEAKDLAAQWEAMYQRFIADATR
ncbi:MAG: arylsulfatase [Planctomycetales bacterium]|nr:arylsulfatase [Planctomycetales bacterium]